MVDLKIYSDLPPGFLEAAPEQLEAVLGGPSLIHLPGVRQPPLFVSVLLHGNETSGVAAIQRLLEPYRNRILPRSLSIFVGNVAAARFGARRLDGQPDYNRVWPGGEAQDSPEARMMAHVVEQMRRRGVFASIDVHNNTGRNPHYACINRLDGRYVYLASLFGRTMVYFTRPPGVQSLAFAEFAPAVTLECGQPTSEYGAAHAREFIEAVLHLQHIPEHPSEDVAVYHTVGIVRVPGECSFGFGRGDGVQIELLEDLEELNFRELPVGTTLARVSDGARLVVEDNAGQEAAERFLQLQDGEIRTRRHVMPAMFTHDERVIRQDCLGYLMERIPLPAQ